MAARPEPASMDAGPSGMDDTTQVLSGPSSDEDLERGSTTRRELHRGWNSAPNTIPRGCASGNTDAASLHSARSDVISPLPVARPPSLRTKLSLPGSRRNLSRQDDGSGAAPRPPDPDTAQVQDMDIELVRPNISCLQPKRASEDSSSVGRDWLGNFKQTNSLRADSPTVSMSSSRSPSSQMSEPNFGIIAIGGVAQCPVGIVRVGIVYGCPQAA
jgi:hypothetical protein